MSVAHPPPDVLVVAHTHWDREWYHEAGRLRARLVALVDELLDRPADDRAPFLLDGQAVVLEDYLAVRPARRDALAAALADGRLDGGPWYVLADGLLPGGEALVRNLLAGRRLLARLGAAAPPVLYAPDAFGHPAALPTLAAGFGLPLAVVWRGYGGPRWPDGDAAWWRGPDGSRVLLHHLPPDGYELGSRLPPALPSARERWAALHAVLAPRARLGLLLVMNGADHHARQERWAESLDALARAANPHPVRAVGLGELARLAVERARDAGLPEVAGELRDSYGYAWTLQGTLASRAAQKRRAATVERLLVRDVEPWLALAALAAPGERAATARRHDLLDAVWRTLLRCHPHDTLCGCSIDAVARAMDARLDDAAAQGEALRAEGLDALLGHDPVLARGRREWWRPTLVVRNRSPWRRGGVATVELLGFVRDVGVGPGSAGAWRPVRGPVAEPVHPHDAAGRPLLVQPLGRALRHDRVESPRHYPDDDLVEATEALVWIPPLDGFALRTHPLGVPPDGAPPDGAAADGGPVGPARPVRVADNRLDNGLVAVAVDGRGRVRVESGDVVVDDLLAFEDVGDAGDLYTHSPVGAPLASAWRGSARTVHRGPLRGEVELRWRLRVPAGLAPRDDGDLCSRPERRGGGHVELPLTARVAVDAELPLVRVRITGDNRARDHRLRLVVATGVAAPRVLADAAFGPVERPAGPVAPDLPGAGERVPATAPLHRHVTLAGADRGATLFSDGLAEYEAMPDGRLAVTLVRAVGELSRPDLPERPGHAGWPAATPEAQCAGPFEAAFAIAWHGADGAATRALVERLADDALLPLVGGTRRAALALPADAGGLTLAGEGLGQPALLPADDGQVVARCVNLTDAPVDGAWEARLPLAAAVPARLDGTPLPDAAAPTIERHAAGCRVRFTAAPRGVVTLLLRAGGG